MQARLIERYREGSESLAATVHSVLAARRWQAEFRSAVPCPVMVAGNVYGGRPELDLRARRKRSISIDLFMESRRRAVNGRQNRRRPASSATSSRRRATLRRGPAMYLVNT